jgi:hypothetical protein
MHSNGLLVVVATMIYDHEWRGAEVRRNFGVLSLSFQTVRRTSPTPWVHVIPRQPFVQPAASGPRLSFRSPGLLHPVLRTAPQVKTPSPTRNRQLLTRGPNASPPQKAQHPGRSCGRAEFLTTIGPQLEPILLLGCVGYSKGAYGPPHTALGRVRSN